MTANNRINYQVLWIVVVAELYFVIVTVNSWWRVDWYDELTGVTSWPLWRVDRVTSWLWRVNCVMRWLCNELAVWRVDWHPSIPSDVFQLSHGWWQLDQSTVCLTCIECGVECICWFLGPKRRRSDIQQSSSETDWYSFSNSRVYMPASRHISSTYDWVGASNTWSKSSVSCIWWFFNDKHYDFCTLIPH